MGRTLKSFKSYRKILMEMPLPKDMSPDALDPKAGKYSKAQPEKALQKHGQMVGKGSSRIAYRVHVEKEQFEKGQAIHLPSTVPGKIDTVFKLALNGKGIAQNKQEIQTFNYYEHLEILLPIIDSSEQHKTKIFLANGGEWDSAPETVSNWIQMPYAPSFKSPAIFAKSFNEYFGQWIPAIKEHHGDNRTRGAKFPFQLLSFVNQEDLISMLYDLSEGEYINEEQLERTHALCELGEAGLGLADLGRGANWGLYQGRPVILDYGFDDATKGLYMNATIAEAFVDRQGNIRLDVRKINKGRWDDNLYGIGKGGYI